MIDIPAAPVSPLPTAEDDISEDDRSLGLAIRKARQAQNLSLQQVAEMVNISVGLLSQIERGISSPSIRALRLICAVLDMPVHALFNGSEAAVEQEARRIVRVNQRRRVSFGAKGMVKEFLNAHNEGVLQVMEITLEPNGGSGEDTYNHEGEECGVVLEGRLEIHIDGSIYRLAEGDSFYFESPLPHRFRNLADGQTRVLWITTPPVW
ncbi:cupin domain-containing protein [Insolitispirillum peregrinum]|uniref:cupin domain-containing protein n=1 Tax=Insolitispirillum peregrinum TaxID=80876 RepID=UPI00361B4DC6